MFPATPQTPQVLEGRGPAQTIVDLLGRFVRECVEPRVNNIPLWEGGLREVATQFVIENGVPSQPISMVELARRCGMLKPVKAVRNVRP